MPRLDDRLKAVAQQIRSDTHVDIGSDHGHLLLALLRSGRISHGIAIENKRQPFLNSQSTLADVNADVRLGDGLAPLNSGEADTLSICGMGGRSVVKILAAHPDRVPEQIILQPNDHVKEVRRWGWDNGFALRDEMWVQGKRVFEVLLYDRLTPVSEQTSDPAYQGFNLEVALELGPHHLRRQTPMFIMHLHEEQRYFRSLAHLQPDSQRRLDAIDISLACKITNLPQLKHR